MNKQKALERIEEIKNEVKQLEKIIKDDKDYKYTDIRSFEDACRALGFKAETPYIKIQNYDSIVDDVRSITAYSKLIVICRALNEGWEPDWDNTNEYKYYPYFNMQSGFSLFIVHSPSSSYAPGRLVFKTEAVARYAATQFLGLYKQYYNNA